MGLKQYLLQQQKLIDAALGRYLPRASMRPKTLHEAMRRRVEQWSEECGVAFLPREDRRSWTVSCLRLPEGKSAKQLIGALKEQGWVIGSGYGALKDTTIRIGHMGDHTVEGLNRLLPLVGLQLA